MRAQVGLAERLARARGGRARGGLGARGGAFVAPTDIDWLDAYAERLRMAMSPLGLLNRNGMAMAAE